MKDRSNGMTAVALGIALALASCKAETVSFTGEWKAVDLEGAYFGLTLIQEDSNISGWHDGGLADGSRIDVAIGTDEPSVTGTVKGRVATLRIVSGYSEDVAYKATLTMRKDGKAAWNVIDRTTGQTYIPEVALMAVTGLSSGASDPVDLPDDGMMTGADIIRGGNALIDSIDLSLEDIAPAVKDLEGSTEGGEAAFYRDETNRPLKLIVRYFGETGRVIREYYYDGEGSVGVARFTIVDYHGGPDMVSPGGEKMGNPGRAETTTAYLDDGTLIMLVGPDGTELSSDSEELNDVEGFLVTEPATFAFLGLK